MLVLSSGSPSVSSVVGLAPHEPEALSVALQRSAQECYELFSEARRIPEWLRVVRSIHVTRWNEVGRASEVAFLTRLDGGTVGYTCRYSYDDQHRQVSWATPSTSNLRVAGSCQFAPLGERSCMMTYRIDIDMGGLPAWSDPSFAGHAPSAAAHEFREYALRVLER